MTDTSDRLGLPLLAPGQAQKELFHNEALAAIDIALQASVVAVNANTPPASPATGQCWVVGTTPTGAWAGRTGTLAGWTSGGWRFVVPIEGMAVWDASAGQVARRITGAWVSGTLAGHRLMIDGVQVVASQRAAISTPAAGDVVDAQARAAIASILSALRGHGLIAT